MVIYGVVQEERRGFVTGANGLKRTFYVEKCQGCGLGTPLHQVYEYQVRI